VPRANPTRPSGNHDESVERLLLRWRADASQAPAAWRAQGLARGDVSPRNLICGHGGLILSDCDLAASSFEEAFDHPGFASPVVGFKRFEQSRFWKFQPQCAAPCISSFRRSVDCMAGTSLTKVACARPDQALISWGGFPMARDPAATSSYVLAGATMRVN
jgi:hypothetical protein